MILINTLTGISFLLLLITGIQGYLGFALLDINHPTLGFFTAIIYLFTEVIAMFFFATAGVSIKDYIQKKRPDPKLHEQSATIKRKFYPHTLLNIILVMTLFTMGEAVETHIIPAWIHGGLFVVTIFHFGFTIGKQRTCFKENSALILEMVNMAPSQDEIQ